MKAFKIYIVKFFAIAISAVYILMPIHKEVKDVLHSMSHYLKMPNVVLSHDFNNNLGYKNSEATTSNHNHKIIDLLDYIIDVTPENKDSNKPNLVDSKIDKHFHSSKYKLINFVLTAPPIIIKYHNEKIKDGFYKKIKIPPQKLLMRCS